MKQFVSMLTLVIVLAPPPAFSGGDWTGYYHPCPGASRTDALHRDGDGSLWVGCGTTSDGKGLYASFNGGANWTAIETNPAGQLDEFRVNSIVRGHDGALYAAGVDIAIGSNVRVLRLDTDSTLPYATTPTLIATPQVGRQFTVGNYGELSDGRAMADSATGFDRLYRPDAATGPLASDWIIPPVSLDQFTRMIVHDDKFFAAGSRINVPPKVFLPPQSVDAEPWDMEEIILDNSFDGELWDIAAYAGRVAAVGVDQDSNTGKIYVSNGDPYNAGNYLVHNLPDIVGPGGVGTWARGVCMRSDWIVVVGERQPLGGASGLAMASSNGGLTFTNITPPAPPETISRCVIAPDGLVIVAGAAGFIGIWDGFMPGDEIFSSRFQAED